MKFESGRALVIAIADYHHVPRLPAAVIHDAQDIASVLSAPNHCGYDPNQVEMLLNADATLAAIRRALSDLAGRCKKSDTAFIFFSGHGARLKVGGGETSALLPVDCRQDDLDSSTLSEGEFSVALASIPAERLVVILDACHSGGAGTLKRLSPGELEYGIDEKALSRLSEGIGRVIIASSRATETSLILAGARNSLFTEHTLEALRGKARTHGDGKIRVFEIFNYVSEKVRNAAPGRQHPIFKASDVEDNFPVALHNGGSKGVVQDSWASPEQWGTLESVLADLYPMGPTDQDIWARAGGDLSTLQLTGTGRALWFSSLKKLRQGGGGENISIQSLVRIALGDFPHHPELQRLLTAVSR
jgi:metacaspase-1